MAEEKKPAPKKADKKKGGIGQWFHDMKGEMKKIVWPTKETTIKNTGLVIGMCAVVGVFLCAFDGIAGTIVSTLFTVFG